MAEANLNPHNLGKSFYSQNWPILKVQVSLEETPYVRNVCWGGLDGEFRTFRLSLASPYWPYAAPMPRN